MIESLKSPSVPYTVEFGIDSQGEPWVYQSRYDYSANGYTSVRVPVSGDRLQDDHEPNLDGNLPKDFEPMGFNWLHRLEDNVRRQRYQYSSSIGRKNLVSAPNGTVLIYDGVQFHSTASGCRNAVGVSFSCRFDRQAIHGDALLVGIAASAELAKAGYEPLWIDRDGIYQFDRIAVDY